ncbi:MAG: LTA synthase family protein [Pseudomonadota bacterium]
MIELIPLWLLSLVGVVVADAFTRPGPAQEGRVIRFVRGLWVTGLVASTLFGSVLALSGNPDLAAFLTVGLAGLFTFASNAKRRVLGEPLVFSDLALLGAMVKHPQFYFSVLALWQQVLGAFALLIAIGVVAWLMEPSVTKAIAGSAIAATGAAVLMLSVRLGPWRRLAREPDLNSDVATLGLVPTLLLYWMRWKQARSRLIAQGSPASQDASAGERKAGSSDDLIVVVQCESFADPTEVFAQGGSPLPHLGKAKRRSAQWGNLLVSGFGAYTMRTEYGVLFGRDESELGFLLYDPYLTAQIDPARALPQKLGADQWRSLFVHPHDMRFYGRDEILPKAGFDELIGEGRFPEPEPPSGRYVNDAAVATKILELAHAASGPALIYAVTMENHGRWAPPGVASTASLINIYNRLVVAGDAFLGQLMEGLDRLDRPVTLVFFGDHRPTIPGASDPGGDRHTPYVVVPSGSRRSEPSEPPDRVDLTPAQ